MTFAEVQQWLITRLAQLLEIAPAAIDRQASFASYGLASFEAVSLSGELESWLGKSLPETLFYDYPTIESLSHYLGEAYPSGDVPSPTAQAAASAQEATVEHSIAIIGIGCRFPGEADTPERFWQLLRNGRDTIIEIPEERWDSNAFYDPDPQTPGKMYTRSGSFLANIDRFDASFFGLSAHEAWRMDPQQRLLLEVVWETLERAGITLAMLDNSATGVFIGMMNNQEYRSLQMRSSDGNHVDDPYLNLGSASSVAAGRISYLFNLKGPALTIDTACSSSLVAVHLACQSLRNAECSLALVGGVHTNLLPENMVNLCKMGMLSPDGRCHTFDASANGFVLGEGCGVVILKRLTDALADGNPILAVIRGSAVNQDGHSNGLTAPNRHSQEAVIRQSLTNAGVAAHEVDYVETHGSGTALGDPIEVDALMTVMSEERRSDHPLLIGSVKTNIGHLAGASGMAGLLKTVLALVHREIPPHLHVQQPNPYIRWHEYPVEIASQLSGWPAHEHPRIAGVSSFGWSGTNAHLILEEAPARPSSPASPGEHLLLLSAKTEAALEQATKQLAAYLQEQPPVPLADIAYTTQVARTPFRYRRAVVCHSNADAFDALTTLNEQKVYSGKQPESPPAIAFLFPGLGEPPGNNFAELYRLEPVFRSTVEQCCAFLQESLDLDLLPLLRRPATPPALQLVSGQATPDLRAMLKRSHHPLAPTEADPLQQTALAQPALFIFEYALASLLQHWGITPTMMLGYSLGEYVVACLAGVFSLEDALTLVARRARLIQQCPPGAMLAVALSPQELAPYLDEQVELAAINASALCVLSGPIATLEQRKKELDALGAISQWVGTMHAFHSTMLAPVREELTVLAHSISLHEPRIPYISNVTGAWITPEQATNAGYWADHMCQTVRFADGITSLLHEQAITILEVGPGQSLRSYVTQHPLYVHTEPMQVFSLFPAPYEQYTVRRSLLTLLGKLWLSGVDINWKALHSNAPRQILPLPTYPFERESYWIAPEQPTASIASPSITTDLKKQVLSDWFYLPGWKQSVPPTIAPVTSISDQEHWLFFLDDEHIGPRLIERLHVPTHNVTLVYCGETFQRQSAARYTLHPRTQADYEELFKALRQENRVPTHIVHLWSLTSPVMDQAIQEDDAALEETLNRGFYSLLFLAQALGNATITDCNLNVISNHLHAITGQEPICPEKATLLGPCRVIVQEYATLHCRSIDILPPETGSRQEGALLDLLAAELRTAPTEQVVAFRGPARWIPSFEPMKLASRSDPVPRLRRGGVYLITGGLGGIGLMLASHLARSLDAKLVLVGRTMLPPRHEWAQILEQQGDVNGTGWKIRQMQQIERQGTELLIVQADVTNEQEMRSVFEQTISTFGTLHGIFHTAGVPGVGLMQFKTAAMAAGVLAPKVQGTRMLTRVLQAAYPALKLDFLALFSSVTSIVAGPGQVDYCAANAFLDAYASSSASCYDTIVSIDWSEWQWNAWEAGLAGYDIESQHFFRTQRQHLGLTEEEGIEALMRILAYPLHHVIVSPQPLQKLMAIGTSLTAHTLLQRTYEPGKKKHARPAHLDTPYVGPRNELERQIVTIWEELLGLTPVGVLDNFFALGGHSLLGMGMMARVRSTFAVNVTLELLFEAPTIAELALHIEDLLIEEIAQLDD